MLRTSGFVLLGRLAYGVLPLCFLFTVRHSSGSFVIAAAAVFVGVAALADRTGAPATAAVVEAVMAAGAVVGGLLWARFGPAAAPSYALPVLLLGLALAQSGAAPLSSDVLLVAAVLAVGSLATSPVYVVSFVTVDELVLRGAPHRGQHLGHRQREPRQRPRNGRCRRSRADPQRPALPARRPAERGGRGPRRRRPYAGAARPVGGPG